MRASPQMLALGQAYTYAENNASIRDAFPSIFSSVLPFQMVGNVDQDGNKYNSWLAKSISWLSENL